ncbi:sensor histidine kinase [Paenibacillus oryzisoli]|uniref:sensor histidine kinase n=1 Tax=Paenibacillus oryzisoli TaxID=1850517 RepID=UPI003D2690C7
MILQGQSQTNLYVFVGCKWVLLLAGLLLYVENYSLQPELLLLVILAQTVSTLAYLQVQNKWGWLATAAVDLMCTLYLLSHTGGLSSTLLVYSFASILPWKRLMDWRLYYAIVLAYAALLPLLLRWLPGPAAELDANRYWGYGFLVFIFCVLIGLYHYGRLAIYHTYRKLAMIYRARTYAASSSFIERIPYTEELLRKALDGRDVLLILPAWLETGKVQSWKHTYYANYMQQNPPSSPKQYANLPSPTGERVPYYIKALTDRQGSHYGWLLVRANKHELTTIHKIYMQFMLIRLEADHFVRGELAQTAEAAVSLERETIAQNIHDGIAQELFFISIQLFQLKQALPQDAREQMLPHVLEVERKVKESHRDIRQFITELKDEKRKINLHHAIEKLLHRVTEHTKVRPVFVKNGWTPHEQLEVEEAIYHLIEEAANNVIKHAQASHLYVNIEVTSVQWEVTVKDDGKGMALREDLTQRRFGLEGMENRIKALNGTLVVQSEPDAGTTVTACIPRERSVGFV